MVSERDRALLRTFVETFPPLKFALQINDCICYLFKSLISLSWRTTKGIYQFVLSLVKQVCSIIQKSVPCLQSGQTEYERLEKKPNHKEPIPYRNQLFKRSLTYYGGLFLGLLLYIFVYFVLVKHYTYTTLTVAFILLLIYLVVLENSHNIRSILMLCLPMMFTNRGRALVFCCMLTLTVIGPIKNSQLNINELHKSLNCTKQYSILKTDKFVEANFISGVIEVEDVIFSLVDNIKEFAKELEEKFHQLIELALTVERYMAKVIEKLKDIVNICNTHTQEVYSNCVNSLDFAYNDCTSKLGSTFDFLCEIVKPLREVCSVVKLPDVLCEIPKEVVKFIDMTIGVRLRKYIEIVEKEFYVDIDIDHAYSYNGTKSKTFKTVWKEIKFDVERKFWYVHLITRIFNLVSLILVIWILITATLYHMHFLSELKYDNMYIDSYLQEIDERRKRKSINTESEAKIDMNNNTLLIQNTSSPSPASPSPDEDSPSSNEAKKDYLFPMLANHEKKYLKPFSIWMNNTERHKLYIAGLVWCIIIGYISFFLVLDYGLYQLIELVDFLLREILFTDELPLVDIQSKSDNQIVKYNRTYLSQLRTKTKSNSTSDYRKRGGLSSMYRRLMDSIEHNIPDDIAILDSLEQCLPKPHQPNFDNYKSLLYLAIFTFGAVILEAYALRTRHCIANLYYPVRARKRAVWLYRKLVKERPKFESPEEFPKEESGPSWLELGLRMLTNRIKR